MKIFFEWEVEGLRRVATTPRGIETLSKREHAFIFALYLISLVSLQDDECESLLGQSRPQLLLYFESLSEQALTASNFMGATDILILQASTLYIVSVHNQPASVKD